MLGCRLRADAFPQRGRQELTDEQLTQLAVNGETGIIKGFTSKSGKSFEASLSLGGAFKTVFVFPERKKPGKSRR